jgi:hypothetical protein
MNTALRSPKAGLATLVATFALAACSEGTPLEPVAELETIAAEQQFEAAPDLAAGRGREVWRAIATMRRVTARYHDLNAALADGFVLLHPCEERPDEGPVGAVYVHMGRLDGRIDARAPEALIYEPAKKPGRRARLVGVEFAIPYTAWTRSKPPQFLGQTFQKEDEFGVWALHAWVWRHNPEGMFAESNPRVSCGD